MRFHSTPESVLSGEITKLAIIECVVAVALYIGIGVYFQTFRHLAVAVGIAPLMLFRSEVSARWGLKAYGHATGRYMEILHFTDVYVNSDSDLLRYALGIPLIFFGFLTLSAIAVLIRVVATLYWALRSPLYTLSEMPQNWLRQSFCIDLFYPPELLPLEAVYGEEYGWKITLGSPFKKEQKDDEEGEHYNNLVGLLTNLVGLLAFSPFILFGYLPSLFYRISFKATSLVYFPFIWVAQRTLRSSLSVKLRLERITKGELEKIGRYLSTFALMVLAAKIGLAFGLTDVISVIAQFPRLKFVEILVVPNIWPWWLCVLWATAVLSFGLLFYCDAALSRLNSRDSRDAWPEQNVITIVSTASFVRASLGVVAMVYFFQCAVMTLVGSYFGIAL